MRHGDGADSGSQPRLDAVLDSSPCLSAVFGHAGRRLRPSRECSVLPLTIFGRVGSTEGRCHDGHCFDCGECFESPSDRDTHFDADGCIDPGRSRYTYDVGRCTVTGNSNAKVWRQSSSFGLTVFDGERFRTGKLTVGSNGEQR